MYDSVDDKGHAVELPVIVEPLNGNGFRAIGAGGISLGLAAEGATASEAVDRLSEQVRTRLKAGAKLAAIRIPAEGAAWAGDAGYLREDPQFEAWREAMDEYRDRLDKDPEAL